MTREYTIGGPFGAGYVSDAADRDFMLASAYLASLPVASSGTTPPVFRSKAATNYASDVTPHNVSKPTGTVADDILIAIMAINLASGENAAPPDGTWTAIHAATLVTSSVSFNVKVYGWWKRAGSSEPSSYDFTDDVGASRAVELVMAAYSGCVTSGSPIDAVSVNNGTGTSATALSITTTVDNTLLVVADQNWDASNVHVPPTGFTERHEFITTINDATQAVAGASGNKGPYTSGTVSASDPWQSWMFALKPVPAAGGAPSGKPKVWTGSAWAEKPAKVWSGSAWVQKPVKVWTGSAWKTVGGAAGPSAPTSVLVTAFTPGTDRNDFTGQVGVRLGLGGSNIPISWMGMRKHSAGQTGNHTVKLFEWFADTLERSAVIDLTGVSVGSWGWTAISPYTLLASGYYGLMLEVVASDGHTWCNPGACTFVANITNVYDIYRIGAGAMATGTINDMFNGLDLGN